MKTVNEEIREDSCVDLPFKATRDHYSKAVDLLISHWQSLPNSPTSIYQIGQVGVPGISDLDFILVFSKSQAIDWEQFKPSSFPDWVQQLMTHPPYVCLESDWELLPAWYPTFNLKHLTGQILPEPDLEQELLPGCALGMLVDYFIVKVPQDFFTIAWGRPLRVRILLAMLHSLKYTIKMADDAQITVPRNAESIISDVDKLRKNWLELNNTLRMETLFSLYESACKVTGELITNVDKKLSDEGGKSKEILQSEEGGLGGGLFRFKSCWNYKDVLEQTIKNYSSLGVVDWINPESLLHVISVYADECPNLGKYLEMRGCKMGKLWYGGIWDKGLRYHARAMEKYGKSSLTLGIPAQKYVALGYSPPLAPKLSFSERLKRLVRFA